MTWDSVPWFVGGGAEHSPEVARLLAYAATNASEGIVSPGDLKVAPLDVPGSSVKVLAGAAIILSDAAGGAQQSYVGRNVSQDVVNIAATGSGSGRSDLIVARVEDPFMAGEPYANPANAKVGPYIFTRVIPNVSPSATVAPAGSSSIALARIDIPANTGTITAGMVKDLRVLAQARSSLAYDVQNPPVLDYVTTSETAWHNWPTNALTVNVPAWATHAQVSIKLLNLATDGPCDVNTRVQFGGLLGPTAYFDYNGNVGTPAGWVETKQHETFAEFLIPTNYQGTSQTVRLNARRTYETANRGNVWADSTGTQVAFDVRFAERTV